MRKAGLFIWPVAALLLLSCGEGTVYGPVGNFSEGLALVPVDGLWGYIDTTGTMVIQPQYSMAEAFSHGIAVVKKENKFGVINAAGQAVVPVEYDEITGFENGFARVRKGGEWGYINQDGQLCISLQYDKANPFAEGMAAVHSGSGWGYIFEDGAKAIDFKFDEAQPFSNGLAWVKVAGDADENWGLVDTVGEVLSTFPGALEVRPFEDGMAAFSKRVRVLIEGKEMDKVRWGFIGLDGKVAVEPTYVDVHDFSEGMAAVMGIVEGLPKDIEGMWGYIDTSGDEIIPLEYYSAADFHEGTAVVEVSVDVDRLPADLKSATEPLQHNGLIRMQLLLNKAGMEVVPPRYNYIGPFKNGLAVVRQGIFPMQKWGYIDRSGQEVVQLKYNRALDFHAGLAGVAIAAGDDPEKSDAVFGYIDTMGKEVIDFKFDLVGPFIDGRARVMKDDKWAFIDHSGSIVWTQE